MSSRQVQGYPERVISVTARDVETGMRAVIFNRLRPVVGVRSYPVGDVWPVYARQDLPDAGVIGADDDQSVKRQAVQEIDEIVLQGLVTAAAVLQVVGVDIRQHRVHRRQVQEGGVTLVRLRHDIFPLAEPGMGTGHVQAPADNIGGIVHALRQQAGDQAGGCGFAVGTGHRDPFPETHQFGQHFRARDDGYALPARRQQFRVVGGDGARIHHDVAAVH